MGSEESFFNPYLSRLMTLQQGNDVGSRSHAQKTDYPPQRYGGVSP
jgi:hypothetical protein